MTHLCSNSLMKFSYSCGDKDRDTQGKGHPSSELLTIIFSLFQLI